MTCGRGDDLERTNARGLPPIQFDDTSGRDAPAFQMRTHAERHHEHCIPIRHGSNRRPIEMVIVVMGNHDDVDPRQLAQPNGRGIPPLGPDPTQRRRSLAPQGIGQHRHAIDLDQHGRVPEPGHTQSGRGGDTQCLAAVHHDGDECIRHVARRGFKRAQEPTSRVCPHWLLVREAPFRPLRRVMHPTQPLVAGIFTHLGAPVEQHSSQRAQSDGAHTRP